MVTTAVPSRNDFFHKFMDRAERGIEVGPWFAPIAPRSAGWDVLALDVFGTEELVAKAATIAAIPAGAAANIEPVDLVGPAERIAELAIAAGARPNSFGFVISSHNFEHLPNPIAFLRGVEQLLRPGGHLVMALPDRRTCFDHLRPASTLGEILQAWLERRSRPTPRQVFDHHLGTAVRVFPDGSTSAYFPLEGWDGSVQVAGDCHAGWHGFQADAGGSEGPYPDAHCWTFTPAELLLHLADLRRLGLVQLQTVECVGPFGVEFFLAMRMPEPSDEAAPAPPRAAEIDAVVQERRRSALTRCAGDAAVAAENPAALVADLQRRLAAAERAMESFRQSRSWRLTRPLRSLAAAFRGTRLRPSPDNR